MNIVATGLFDEAGRLVPVRKRGTRAFMLPGGKAEPSRGRCAGAYRSRKR
ncbi:hypothetical protein [Pseudomonas sp. R-28-1W-6]